MGLRGYGGLRTIKMERLLVFPRCKWASKFLTYTNESQTTCTSGPERTTTIYYLDRWPRNEVLTKSGHVRSVRSRVGQISLGLWIPPLLLLLIWENIFLQTGVVNSQVAQSDDKIYCRFQRPGRMILTHGTPSGAKDLTFDLFNTEFYLFLAWGDLYESKHSPNVTYNFYTANT